jgi:hypothetical protein
MAAPFWPSLGIARPVKSVLLKWFSVSGDRGLKRVKCENGRRHSGPLNETVSLTRFPAAAFLGRDRRCANGREGGGHGDRSFCQRLFSGGRAAERDAADRPDIGALPNSANFTDLRTLQLSAFARRRLFARDCFGMIQRDCFVVWRAQRSVSS